MRRIRKLRVFTAVISVVSLFDKGESFVSSGLRASSRVHGRSSGLLHASSRVEKHETHDSLSAASASAGGGGDRELPTVVNTATPPTVRI